MIIRNNRHVTRIFFLLVLGAAFWGWWYARTHWQIEPTVLDSSLLDDGTIDWVDVVATLAEQVLQLFLGLTSAGN